MKDVTVKPVSDQEARGQRAINHLEGATHNLLKRLTETGDDECECKPADLRDDGDGPCNWCEQMIFAWDSVVDAAAMIRPMVREDYRWGIDLEESAQRISDETIKPSTHRQD